MSDEKAFLLALRARDGDRSDADARDTRAVYADWLEMRGEGERAEFLRGVNEILSLRTLGKKEKHASARAAIVNARLHALAAAHPKSVTADWRRAVLRARGALEFETMNLEAALVRMESAGVARDSVLAERLREHVESLVDGEVEDDPYGMVRLYDGNVVIDDILQVSMSPVVVLGDLDVCGGEITDLIEADQSMLVVAGDMRCRFVWQLGDMVFGRNVACDTFYGASYCEHRTEIFGSIHTNVIFENGHHIVISGVLEANVKLGDRVSVKNRYLKNKELSSAASTLHHSLFIDESIDEQKLYERLQANKSILAESKPSERKLQPKPAKKKPVKTQTSKKKTLRKAATARKRR